MHRTKEGPTLASEASPIAWVGWVTRTIADAYIAIETTPMLKSGQAVSALAYKASRDMIGRDLRFAKCGHRGVSLQHPSWVDAQVGRVLLCEVACLRA
jgi:hypothetical protein